MNTIEQVQLLKSSVEKWNAYRNENPSCKPNLRGANLSNTNLKGAHLEGADLRGANLSNTNLKGAHLEGADLKAANLKGAHLEGADLGGADLWGANLKGAHLEGADLRGANLSNTNLKGAHLEGADLMNVIGNKTIILSLRFDTYTVVINTINKIMWCGCTRKTLLEWKDVKIEDISDEAKAWWKLWKPVIFQIIAAKNIKLK